MNLVMNGTVNVMQKIVVDSVGSIFETSEIRLKDNNSRFKYNQHL
jgi:hypothetical protein